MKNPQSLEDQAERIGSSGESSNKEQTTLPVPSDFPSHEQYLRGWRVYGTNISLSIAIFLSSLDLAIVTTALVPIANSFHSFEQGSWIVNSYMLTYTGFLVILSKLSDVFGRKSILAITFTIFIVFSAGCGASQTATQLIVLRAFQGIGGAGMYSVTYIILFEVAPPEKYAMYTAMVTSMVTLAVVCGVVLGGAISSAGAWRWIFWVNIPVGCIALAILLVSLPNGFPHYSLAKQSQQKHAIRLRFPSTEAFKRVDYVGTACLLCASVFLVAALEEAAAGRPWKSALIISFLCLSGIFWPTFFLFERKLTRASKSREPIFPWRLATSRQTVGLFMSMLLVGGQYTVCLVALAQRYQTLHSMSPLQASLRVLPFGLASPFAGTIAAGVSKKRQIPPIYFCLAGSLLQIVGMTLMATSVASPSVFGGFYGFQVVSGVGVGFNLILLTLMTPLAVEEQDKATALGSVLQSRNLGGALCVAITATIFNNYVRTHLGDILTQQALEAVLRSSQSITLLPVDIQDTVKQTFGKGSNLQFMVLVGFAAAQVPTNLLMWRQEQIRVK
ncbi:MFS multidrug transporter-like protein [Periconia macrospinosa]|uniref:MFS multidrug transporter-like protein n=1 Tax=Periconia macrospinosa TaxID=97972 RepID=A0A2V1D6X3_9PLEO|nr:MFS multidrug transporter-like protein [Periconia macrospinosa]